MGLIAYAAGMSKEELKELKGISIYAHDATILSMCNLIYQRFEVSEDALKSLQDMNDSEQVHGLRALFKEVGLNHLLDDEIEFY